MKLKTWNVELNRGKKELRIEIEIAASLPSVAPQISRQEPKVLRTTERKNVKRETWNLELNRGKKDH